MPTREIVDLDIGLDITWTPYDSVILSTQHVEKIRYVVIVPLTEQMNMADHLSRVHNVTTSVDIKWYPPHGARPPRRYLDNTSPALHQGGQGWYQTGQKSNQTSPFGHIRNASEKKIHAVPNVQSLNAPFRSELKKESKKNGHGLPGWDRSTPEAQKNRSKSDGPNLLPGSSRSSAVEEAQLKKC